MNPSSLSNIYQRRKKFSIKKKHRSKFFSKILGSRRQKKQLQAICTKGAIKQSPLQIHYWEKIFRGCDIQFISCCVKLVQKTCVSEEPGCAWQGPAGWEQQAQLPKHSPSNHKQDGRQTPQTRGNISGMVIISLPVTGSASRNILHQTRNKMAAKHDKQEAISQVWS